MNDTWFMTLSFMVMILAYSVQISNITLTKDFKNISIIFILLVIVASIARIPTLMRNESYVILSFQVTVIILLIYILFMKHQKNIQKYVALMQPQQESKPIYPPTHE